MSARLRLSPCSLREANSFIAHHHRHHPPVRGCKATIAVVCGDAVTGVAVLSRPRSRVLQASGYIECTRLCTCGERNAGSFLYAAVRRLAAALGYDPAKLVTYTLPSECGASLRAAGWICEGDAGGGTWDRAARRRNDRAPTDRKLRWRAA